jgi:hypothetical protein
MMQSEEPQLPVRGPSLRGNGSRYLPAPQKGR